MIKKILLWILTNFNKFQLFLFSFFLLSNFIYIFLTGFFFIIILNFVIITLIYFFPKYFFLFFLFNNLIHLMVFFYKQKQTKSFKNYLELFNLQETPVGVFKNKELVFGNVYFLKIFNEIKDQLDEELIILNKQIYFKEVIEKKNYKYIILKSEEKKTSLKEYIFEEILRTNDPMQIFLNNKIIWSNTEKLSNFTRSVFLGNFVVKYNFSSFIPELFNIIIDELPIGIMVLDQSKKLLFSNSWVNDIHHHEKKSDSIFANTDTFYNLIDNNIEKDTFIELKNGETVLVRIRNINEKFKLVVIWYDVFENQLSNNKEHTQRLALLGYFLATTSHDVSNISMALRNSIKQLNYLLSENLAVADILIRMEQFVEIIISLVSQTLLLSRKNQNTENSLNINKNIENILSISTFTKNTELSMSLEATRLVAICSVHFFQIFLNVFQNAKDSLSGRKDGSIVISTEDLILKQPMTKNGEYIYPGEYVKLIITDNGHGIPEDQIKNVFTSFYTSKPNGTGLGLSIVYSLLKKNKGHILVSSVLGEGTKFEILFQVYKNSNNLFNRSNKKNILIIDDYKEILSTLQDYISKYFNVFTANNLESATSILENTKIDIILSDINIGNVDITKDIVDISKKNNIKFLFITGNPIDDENFTYPYLNKPFLLTDIMEKIQLLIED